VEQVAVAQEILNATVGCTKRPGLPTRNVSYLVQDAAAQKILSATALCKKPAMNMAMAKKSVF
jgi:hypothetical protein